MDSPPEPVPTTDGYLVVGSDLLRLEADLEQFLTGQTARWDEGDAADRFLVLIEYLVPLGLFWAAAVLYDPSNLATSVVAALSALSGLGLMARTARLGDVEIDHDAVEAVHLDLAERTLDLEYDDYRPMRWATPEQSGYETTLRFPTDEAARRARTALTESPLDDRLDVTESEDEDVETDHRVDVEDGVLFCESCDTQVSPTDRRCPSCNYGLWPETTAEPPAGTGGDDEERRVVETDYRVEIVDGVLFCESCGSQVSPSDELCPSCTHRIWTAGDSSAGDYTVDDPERETETVYRVETENGVPFCENCGGKVSPTDDACRSCDYELRVERVVVDGDYDTADDTAGGDTPDGTARDDAADAPERETETVYRVETENGVPFCENCGGKVSPTDDACRSCDYELRVEREVATEVEE